MNIVIEKGIPFPARQSKSAEFIAAVKLMEIGDSFIYRKDGGGLGTLISAARHHLKYKMSFRKTPDGVRVWRIK